MTPRERAAFNAGIETARQMALITAMTIETRDGSRIVRDQAAVAALQGLADGLKVAFLDPPTEPEPMRSVFAAIHAEDGDSGTVECPTCKGCLAWVRDSSNGHLHGQCETEGCLRWMQ
ncbi:hypothetical protein WYO_5471 [Methylobacterium sp. GXF4]|uniref:hypothetical protein n=1 Tax=Methylobacterium sp. GXF4 TaxID=1096546 RepID=UPI000269AA07|nr:hypothetical protein [Methylobacterium sp. GXF4]EIZ81883.1 hypothetical protein WYO_5471 [Methylobacterium sp. GXF4]